MNLVRWFAVVCLFGCAAAVAESPSAAPPDCSAIPGSVQKGPSRLYEGDTLFEYMDGNSEGYFIYGFLRMNGVSCSLGGDTILIDISEFPDPESAYGMFLANRDIKKPIEAIGTGAQTVPRKLIFTKDRFFIEITAQQDADHTAQLRAIAQAIETRVAGTTARPDALLWFPPGMAGDSARLVPESVLGLRALKRGYLAQYPEGRAFVVTEASEEAAGAVMAKLRARFTSARRVSVSDDAFETTDPYLGEICVFRKGRRVGGYSNLTDPSRAEALAAAFASHLPER